MFVIVVVVVVVYLSQFSFPVALIVIRNYGHKQKGRKCKLEENFRLRIAKLFIYTSPAITKMRRRWCQLMQSHHSIVFFFFLSSTQSLRYHLTVETELAASCSTYHSRKHFA